MTDEKQDPTADPIKQRAAEICTGWSWHEVNVQMLVERALREGMAMNERDAARYRWLREQDDEDFRFAVVKNPHFDVYESPQELDAAIDAAMLARNEHGSR